MKLLACEAKMEAVIQHLRASRDAGIGGYHPDPTLAQEVLAEIKAEHKRWRDACRKPTMTDMTPREFIADYIRWHVDRYRVPPSESLLRKCCAANGVPFPEPVAVIRYEQAPGEFWAMREEASTTPRLKPGACKS